MRSGMTSAQFTKRCVDEQCARLAEFVAFVQDAHIENIFPVGR
jgi:hypothetical protein